MAGPRLAGKVASYTGAGRPPSPSSRPRRRHPLRSRGRQGPARRSEQGGRRGQRRALIAGEGGEAETLVADVTREGDCRAMVDEALRRWGRLDILDNNVGIGSRTAAWWRWTRQSGEQIMKVNVTSMMLASKHAIPAMIRSGGGAIVNISSISALRPRGLTAYSTSKGAVIALTRAMAIDHAAHGIRVNCIAPGPVYTPMVYAGGMSDDLRQRRRQASPLGIEGRAGTSAMPRSSWLPTRRATSQASCCPWTAALPSPALRDESGFESRGEIHAQDRCGVERGNRSAAESMVALRRDFHRHPELSFEERRTAEIIAERLHLAKLEVRTGIARTGWSAS